MSTLIATLEQAAGEAPGPAQLAAVLAAWRIAPNARLVGIIDDLSRRCAGAPIVERDAWVEAVRSGRPDAVPDLVEGLVQAPWADVDLLAMLLVRDPDPRFVAAHRRLHQKFVHHHRRVDELLERHRLGSAELPAAAIPHVERIAAAIRAIDDVESRLRADVFADPHDDTARMVYADYLQQRGDPLGELIALQLAGKDAKQLEKRLFTRCLGALEHAVTSGGLERGFVVEATVGWNVEALAAVVDRPDWATLRKLRLAPVHEAALVARLLANPALAHLEELSGVTAAALAAFPGVLPALRRLRLAYDELTLDAVPRLRAEALPALDEVHVEGERLAQAVRRCPIGPQLAYLEVACYPHEVGLCLLDHTGRASCILVVTAMHEVLTLRDRVLHTRRVAPDALVAMLDQLPPSTFREVHVAERLEGTDHARVGRSAGRHGGLLVGRPA
jgi:uncharacterized protein (TIGR02996 family)